MKLFNSRRVKPETELATVTSQVAQQLSRPFRGSPSRVVTGFGLKGGGNVTTALCLAAQNAAIHATGMAVAVDYNPNSGTLPLRLLGHAEEGQRLVDLCQSYSEVAKPNDLERFFDYAGRLRVLHNAGIHPKQISPISRDQYAGVLDTLADFAQLIFVDTGNAYLDEPMAAALERTDHLLIAMITDDGAMKSIAESLKYLRDEGHEDLVRSATVVVSVHDPAVTVASLEPGLAWYRKLCSHVEIIGFDPALSGGGYIDQTQLNVATRLSTARIVAHVAGQLHHVRSEAKP